MSRFRFFLLVVLISLVPATPVLSGDNTIDVREGDLNYALAFRTEFDFLRISRDQIRVIHQNPQTNASFDRLGLYLTDEEWAEFERRDKIASNVGVLRPFVERSLGEAYAGLWIDQLDRGKIKVGYVAGVPKRQLEEIAARVLSISNLQHDDFALVPARFSETELLELQTSISQIAGVLGVGYRPNLNRLEVNAGPSVHLKGIPADAYATVDETVLEAGLPASAHPLNPRPAGLYIGLRDGPSTGGYVGCTSGFNAHTTSGTRGFITAGHCVGSGWATADVIQGTTTNFLGTNVSVVDRTVNDATDAVFIATGSSSDTHCHHTSSECEYITGRQYFNEIAVGQPVCITRGASNGHQCGTVESYPHTILVGLRLMSYQVKSTVTGGGGDSGSGARGGAKAYGVVHAVQNGKLVYSRIGDVFIYLQDILLETS